MYHTWYYTTLLGQHRRGCQLFRDSEPSTPGLLLSLDLLQVRVIWLLSYIVSLILLHLTLCLVLNKSSRGTHLSCSEFQTATLENCAAIYRLRETSHLCCSGGGGMVYPAAKWVPSINKTVLA